MWSNIFEISIILKQLKWKNFAQLNKLKFFILGVTANGILLRVNLSQKASNICSPEIEKQATVFTPSARMIIGLQEGQYSNYLSITADDIESQLIDKLPIAVKGRLSGQGILGVSQVSLISINFVLWSKIKSYQSPEAQVQLSRKLCNRDFTSIHFYYAKNFRL